ncbi:type VI secretion system tip protein VgrG [Hafnia alvei]|uniref:type VI secretion system Vgr family protein n=1 Tax=Hafnia alvei TaxID=569 RepID=UPI00061CFCA0|nr:type VI secretion system Vgr family protein [Hafnia alvei]KKF38354.1 type IV secretion protein Rhs [Hafnia alvei]MBW3474209.1 type VI secretion system tip protein VgrG [Hafnia alvei]MDU3156475.1 type VI secretion system tip protein VgrG [Hafnia alvei]TBL44861.1 type VI secretion system tip protein VgrG [Hafnia alvei]TBM14806.1 type VI secretion system tip protein VgrG [Hafnia alvei]
MLNTAAQLMFDHSHHVLKVWDNTAPLDVLAFTGEEHLSQPYRYTIEFTSSAKDIQPAQMLMQDATFTLNATPNALASLGAALSMTPPVMQALRTVHGVIQRFKRLSTSHDESRYEVTLVPRLALLAKSHQHAIYQNLSVPEIVEKILRDRHGFKGQDFLFTLAHTYPKRELVMQYGENDLQFISRLLAEIGIWFRFTADPKLNIDVVEFYDDQQHYQFGTSLPLRNPSGMNDVGVESVWGLTSAHQVVENRVTTRDYNYRQAQSWMDGDVDVTRGDKTTYGEAYHYADNYLAAGDKNSPQSESESGAFYARLRHERYLNQQTLLHGFTTSAALSPGQELKVDGDAPEAFRQGAVIVAISSKARRDQSYEVEFTAIPYSENVCFRPEPSAKPVMAGTIPARVTSTVVNDTYSHIDKDGRYRVSFDFDRDEWQAGCESLWVRQARPYAGDTYGLHAPLLAGTEVAIAFEEGNPDRPYIAYALHDSKHGDHVTLQNYKRNVLRTPANNKLRLDDERGKEHIKLSTEYGGKTQLNLGHLVDSQKQQRGEGFELRTDDWGAIRAGKGIFISADGQPKAGGKVLEMGAAIGQLQQALSLTETLRVAAETAKAELADLQTQKRLLIDTLTELKQAALLLSSPAGIAQITPKSLQLSAGENVTTTSGKNTDFSVLKKFTVTAGEKVSLFAQKLGMKLFASHGKIEIQAQGDEMMLDALKDLRISSSQGKIVISAKQDILLVGSGGAYIRIGDGVVESGAPDKIIERAAVWQKFSGQSASQMAQKWETADFAVTPQVLWPFDDSPVSAQKLNILNGDGSQQESVTSQSGSAEKQQRLSIDSLKIYMQDGE